MKKSSLLSILIIMVLLIGAISGLTLTASASSAGTFKVDDKALKIQDDKFYYTNKAFTYDKSSSANSYFYVAFDSIDEFDGKSAEDLFAIATKVENSVPTFGENDPAMTKYYVFADKLDSGYSSTKVLVYDTVAPTVDADEMNKWLSTSSEDNLFWHNSWVPASREFTLPTKLLEDVNIVMESTAKTVKTVDDKEVTVNDLDQLSIKFEFCPPTSAVDNDEWASCDSDDDYRVTTSGSWHFRYVIEDLAGNVTTSAFFTRHVRDNSAPVIEFSTTQEKVSTTGTKAGEGYKIPTPSFEDVTSNTTYYFVISKLVGEEYVDIYNSDDSEIAEEYQDILAGSDKNITLTPKADEIATSTGDKVNYIYKVTYYAKDAYGFESSKVLDILTTEPDVESDPYQVWKTVLIVISIVSAIGIALLVFIKPKAKSTPNQPTV